MSKEIIIPIKKRKLTIKKGNIVKMNLVDSFKRTNSDWRQYGYLMHRECLRCFKNTIDDYNKRDPEVIRFYTGKRHKLVFGKYASYALREFRKKYGKNYEEGYEDFVKHGEKGLEKTFCFLRRKLDVKFTDNSKDPFQYEIK